MIRYYKLMKLLEENGITTTDMRRLKIVGQGTLTNLMKEKRGLRKKGGGGLNEKTINTFCKILNCQPGDIMEYVDEDEKSNDNSLEDSYQVDLLT